jgi:hypothetical protein
VPEPLLQCPDADTLFLMVERGECFAELVEFPSALDAVVLDEVLQNAEEVAFDATLLSRED